MVKNLGQFVDGTSNLAIVFELLQVSNGAQMMADHLFFSSYVGSMRSVVYILRDFQWPRSILDFPTVV